MLKVNEALERIYNRAKPLGTIEVPISMSLGFVLAKDIHAKFDLPPFDQSAVDGYAAGSHGFKFKVLKGDIKAGDIHDMEISGDQAVKIFTGAKIPKGTYAVIPKENAILRDGYIEVNKVFKKGDNIRLKGEDVKKGDLVIKSGTLITPPIIGVLASLGYSSVKVYKKPSVAVITTGNELVDIGEKIEETKIVDSNYYQISAMLEGWGIKVSYRERVPDDPEKLMIAISKALEHSNIVITVGGVSVGDYDFVKDVVKKLGIRKDFWQVLQKPGKPLFFGVKGRKLFFGLPGNPVAVSVCMYIYVRAAIRKMMGLNGNVFEDFVYAIISEDIQKGPQRLEFIRGYMYYPKDRKYLPVVKPIHKRGSHMLSSLINSNALILAEENISHIEHCEEVKVLPLRWFEI